MKAMFEEIRNIAEASNVESAGAVDPWLEERTNALAQEMETDYAGADGSRVVSDYLWARKQLDRLGGEIREVIGYVKGSAAREGPECASLLIEFFVQVYRLVPYLVAVISATVRTFATRASRNQINLHFGLLKIAVATDDQAAQTKALEKLHALANGIAATNGWFRRDGDVWDGHTNLAVYEQLERFSDLDVVAALEYMTDNKFAVVGNAIRERLIDDVRRLEREPQVESLDDEEVYKRLESTPGRQCSPEGQLIAESILSDLESCTDSLPKGVQRILGAIAQTLREPDSCGLTGSQLIEEIKKRAAETGNVTDRQARNWWKEFEACDKAMERVRNALRERCKVRDGS